MQDVEVEEEVKLEAGVEGEAEVEVKAAGGGRGGSRGRLVCLEQAGMFDCLQAGFALPHHTINV